MEKLKLFLKSIGLDATMIEKMVAEAQDFDPKKVALTVKDVMRESLRNDEEFMSELDNSVRGKVLSAKENKILRLTGITKDELEALPKEKRFDALLELAVERLKTQSGGDEPTKQELKRLQDRVTELTGLVSTEKERAAKAEKLGESARDRVYIERDVFTDLSKRNLVIGADDATEMALIRLEQAYDLKRKDGKTTLYKKGTELLATNPENERPFTLADALEHQVKERKWIKESNGAARTERITTSETNETRPTGPGGPRRQLVGMEAAAAAAAARKGSKKGSGDGGGSAE